MKNFKRYSIQYSTQQRPVSKFLAILLTPIILITAVASAILFSAVFAAMLLPVAAAGYCFWKRIQAQAVVQKDDAIEAEFKEIKPSSNKED